jgi:hypothetical protein
MKHPISVLIGIAIASMANTASVQGATSTPYTASAFTPAHADLARSAGVSAQLANEEYVAALARVVYYWGYPAVDLLGRTGMWKLMKDGPGSVAGLLPGAPANTSSCAADYMPPSQRWVVTPNNDTIYGGSLLNLALEPAVIQTPSDVPKGQYWTMQIVDAFSNVQYQLGSRAGTPGGKYLLVGPGWQGKKPEGFVDVLRLPTNIGGVFNRSFAARTAESKARAIAVLDQLGVYPYSRNEPGLRKFDCKAYAQNVMFPPGLNAQAVAADPDAFRPQWVNPATFWDVLAKVLDANPEVGPSDAAMAEQARTLIALRASNPAYRTLLDKTALAADAALHDSATYLQVGVDSGNGWQRQADGGVWGSDWFGRAQAALVYIYVNDYREALYLIRGTDAKGGVLNGKYTYTMTFPKDALPPVDRSHGGFWSLTMYDKDYFMIPISPNGRNNVGTVNLDANELKIAPDGSLTITLSHQPPADPDARTNWLPSPEGQFSLILRGYVPSQPMLDGSYKLPNVEKEGVAAQ